MLAASGGIKGTMPMVMELDELLDVERLLSDEELNAATGGGYGGGGATGKVQFQDFHFTK